MHLSSSLEVLQYYYAACYDLICDVESVVFLGVTCWVLGQVLGLAHEFYVAESQVTPADIERPVCGLGPVTGLFDRGDWNHGTVHHCWCSIGLSSGR